MLTIFLKPRKNGQSQGLVSPWLPRNSYTYRGVRSSPYCGIPSAGPLQTSSWFGQSLMGRGWTVWAGGWCCPYSWLPGCTSTTNRKIKLFCTHAHKLQATYWWVPEEGTNTWYFLTAFLGSYKVKGRKFKMQLCNKGKNWDNMMNCFLRCKHSISTVITFVLMI